MKFFDKVEVKNENLEIWKIYPDGRKELAFSDKPQNDSFATFRKIRDKFLETKKKFKWRID